MPAKKKPPEPWKKIYRTGISNADFTEDFRRHRKETMKKPSKGLFRRIASKLCIRKKN